MVWPITWLIKRFPLAQDHQIKLDVRGAVVYHFWGHLHKFSFDPMTHHFNKHALGNPMGFVSLELPFSQQEVVLCQEA